MNQITPRFRLDAKAKLPPLPAELRIPQGQLHRDVAEGLQLTRASAIALTRLQLALAGGDRRQAMAAIDRLHALDGEIEQLVEHLPPAAPHASGGTPGPAADSPLAALDKHLADQKLALAFEKLALASGIAGPDLVSPEHPLAESAPPPPREEPAPLTDWHAFPDVQTEVWDRIPAKAWGALAALVLLALAAAAVMLLLL